MTCGANCATLDQRLARRPGSSRSRRPSFEALLDAARRAGDGRAMTVLVSGEAGVGKTRMTAEAAAFLSSQGWWCPVSHGVFLEGGEVPFSGTAELLRAVARSLGEAELRQLLGRSAVDLAGLLPSSAHEERRALDRNAVTAAVVTLLERADHPVCWVLDDLQWMDGATRDLAAYLAKVTVEGPLLLIATVSTDPDERDRLPDGLESWRERAVVTLAPLDREEWPSRPVLKDRAAGDAELDGSVPQVSLPFFVGAAGHERRQNLGITQGVLRASLNWLSQGRRPCWQRRRSGKGCWMRPRCEP